MGLCVPESQEGYTDGASLVRLQPNGTNVLVNSKVEDTAGWSDNSRVGQNSHIHVPNGRRWRRTKLYLEVDIFGANDSIYRWSIQDDGSHTESFLFIENRVPFLQLESERNLQLNRTSSELQLCTSSERLVVTSAHDSVNVLNAPLPG